MKYAKLSRPRLHHALPREKLFAKLDGLRKLHPVIWISSPPGFGKSTFAASYLSRHHIPSIWFQVDSGDTDPATFFFFLSETVADVDPLPLLEPELTNDIPRFARLFFRQYYSKLSPGSVVVFDNIHEINSEQSEYLLEIAFNEVPDDITILALSHYPPPERLSRLQMHRWIGTMDWHDLRLTPEEVEALLPLDGNLEGRHRDWLDRIEGWIAGVVLLREYLVHGEMPPAPEFVEHEKIFRYFAAEIFGRFPKHNQQLLLELSVLPALSPDDAEQLSGDPKASHLLSQLFHSQWFIDRRYTKSGSVTYHFHALFHEYLRHEAAQRLVPCKLNGLLTKAGTIMEGHGQIDQAAQLYREAGAHDLLAHLLCRCAAEMLAKGRGQTWREWMDYLPGAVVEATPWLTYWRGLSLNYVNALRGRQVLRWTERIFEANGDMRGRLLTIAAIIDSYYVDWAEDLHDLKYWIEVMFDALDEFTPSLLDPETGLKIYSRLVHALFFALPDSHMLEQGAQHALKLLPLVENKSEKLAAGGILLNYLNWANTPAARQLAAQLAPLADDPTIGPLHRIFWYRAAIYRLQLDDDHVGAEALLAAAMHLTSHFGLNQQQFHIDLRTALTLLSHHRTAEARTLLDKMREMLPLGKHSELAHIILWEIFHHAQAGNPKAGCRAAENGLRVANAAHIPELLRNRLLVALACCYAEDGNITAATEWASKASNAALCADREFTTDVTQFVAAYGFHVNGNNGQAADLLRKLLLPRRRDEISMSLIFDCFPRMTSHLLALALEEGIGIDMVKGLITRHRLDPPHTNVLLWPWSVAVRGFGSFELTLRGTVVSSNRKAQRRPLLLLKALMIDIEVSKSQQALAAELWPDADDAINALNTTIYRLRKLLQNNAAIVVAAGKIRLSSAVVWTDVAAFNALCDRIDHLPNDTPPGQLVMISEELVFLYRGKFCEGDDENWIWVAREHRHSRFLAAVDQIGLRLEATAKWATAQKLYTHALAVEPLAERIYRGLMRCMHALGDREGAIKMYQRCRETLSIVLGHSPSEETERLGGIVGTDTSNLLANVRPGEHSSGRDLTRISE